MDIYDYITEETEIELLRLGANPDEVVAFFENSYLLEYVSIQSLANIVQLKNNIRQKGIKKQLLVAYKIIILLDKIWYEIDSRRVTWFETSRQSACKWERFIPFREPQVYTDFEPERDLLKNKYSMSCFDIEPQNVLQSIGYHWEVTPYHQALPDDKLVFDESPEVCYFRYKRDTRGRLYARGYNINPQGDDSRKGMLTFSEKYICTAENVVWAQIQIADLWGTKGSKEEKAQWTIEHDSSLEDLNDEAKKPAQYWKSVKEYRKIQAGEPTGFVLHLDEAASGLQLLSVVCRDSKGMKLTGNYIEGFVDPYMEVLKDMSSAAKQYVRDDMKNAVMTMVYSSTAVPKRIFGGDLEDAMAAVKRNFPYAWEFKERIEANSTKDTRISVEINGEYMDVPILKDSSFRIKIDYKGRRFSNKHMFKEPGLNKNYKGDVATVAHILDRLIHDYMVMNAPIKGANFDDFYISLNDARETLDTYNDGLKWLMETFSPSTFGVDMPLGDAKLDDIIGSNFIG